MNTVVNVFIHGIPKDSYSQCIEEPLPSPPSREDEHRGLDKFIRGRLNQIARYEYCTWINGQIPFVTPRDLELWRLRQFVEFLWFWNLPDDDDLALIFNSTSAEPRIWLQTSLHVSGKPFFFLLLSGGCIRC